MERVFSIIGGLCLIIVSVCVGVAAIVYASKPAAPINIYVDRDGKQVILPQPDPFRPQPVYPYRPGNSGSSKGAAETK